MARGAQVKDGQPAKAEPHLVVDVHAGIVRAPVSDALRHPVQDRRVCLSTSETEHDDKTAHSRMPPFTAVLGPPPPPYTEASSLRPLRNARAQPTRGEPVRQTASRARPQRTNPHPSWPWRRGAVRSPPSGEAPAALAPASAR